MKKALIFQIFSSFYLTSVSHCFDFDHKILVDQNFAQIKANKSSWKGSYIRRSNFELAQLEESNFENCFAYRSNFQSANLRKVNFSGCDLRFADFRNSDIRDANFSGAILFDTLFQGSKTNKQTIIDFQEEPPSLNYE